MATTANRSGHVLVVFAFVYTGMLLGEIPGLALDRTGVALLGAIALVVAEEISPRAASEAVDASTIALLFGLMILSAQFRLAGFYAHVTRRITAAPLSPSGLLALLILVAGVHRPALQSRLPAVMLLLPMASTALAGPILALSSTLAGNLILVGSIANLIVVDQAARLGVVIGWREHARVGLPITLITLAIAGAWLWLRS